MATPPIYSGTQGNTPATHTANGFQSYLGLPGQLFVPAMKFFSPTSGDTLVRTSSGIWAQHVPASTTQVYVADLGQILSQALLPNIPVGETGVNYNPPANGLGTGLAIKSAQALYKIGTANLTSGSLAITQSVFPLDNTAATPTVTNLLAATALTLVQRANIYNTTYTPTTANQTMISSALAEILIELNVVTPASSTFDFYGVVLNLTYNY